MNSTITRIGAIAAAAALTVSLASCSSGQSVAEACKIADVSTAEAVKTFETAMVDLQSGGDLGEAFAPVPGMFSDAKAKVRNEEVADALGDLSTKAADVAKALDGFQLPDLSKLDTTDPGSLAELKELTAKAQEVSKALTEKSEEFTVSSQHYAKLCGK